MKLETLKSFNKKKLIIPTIIICFIIIVITIFISHSKYIYKDSITIIDGIVNYKPYDFKIVEMYIEKDNEYEEIETMPELGYIINQELSYCYVDDENIKITNQVYTNEDGEHIIKELPKRSKCILYFDSKSKATYNQLLALNPELKSQGVIDTNGFTGTSEELNQNGLYETEDDYGTTYYFRGNVENNYVKFGKTSDNEDIWWRIIRINGDGSIRMIYAGLSSDGSVPPQNTNATNIKNVQFNSLWYDNMGVGFEYANGIRNGNSKLENGHKSTILTELEKWFEENLEDELNAGYIDENAGFCGDRQAYSGMTQNLLANDTHGINKQLTYYAAYLRIYPNGNPISEANPAKPSLKCPDIENDLFTIRKSNQGTKSLEYSIGLITIDEVVYAGGMITRPNTKCYLYNTSRYFTMSPSNFDGSNAGVFVVNEGVDPGIDSVYIQFGLRPVLNLKPSSLISGDGSSTNPFSID